MGKISKFSRVFASVAVLTIAIVGGGGPPVQAADLSAAPSVLSLNWVSPTKLYERDTIVIEVTTAVTSAGYNTGRLSFVDSMGLHHQVGFHADSTGKAQTATVIDATWAPGPVKLDLIHITNGYGQLTYHSSGYVSKYPSGMQDPAPRAWDPGSMSFSIEPLKKFTSTPKPTLSGTPTVGKPVTATVSTWTPSGATLMYAWSTDSIPFRYGPESTYTPTNDDLGKPLHVTVVATLSGFEAHEETSDASQPVVAPFATGAPATISGTTTVGSTLTASTGGVNPEAEFVTYVWKRNGVAIAGASAAKLLLTSLDAGKKITVTVTARKTGYETLVKTSAATPPILNKFTYTPRPTISGTTRVGETLTAKSAAWSPVPSVMSYEWWRNGVVIPNATAPTYQLVTADVGAALTVRVTARKTGYAPASSTSIPTPTVATNLIIAARPSLLGTARVGQTLTAKTGIWSPTGVSLTYQWNRNGSPIAGATAPSYKVVSADMGSALSVRVTGRKSGYVAKGATSSLTALVTK